jgi:hypothetical protein
MELQVAEIASSAACRGAEGASPFTEQSEFSFMLDTANAELTAGSP